MSEGLGVALYFIVGGVAFMVTVAVMASRGLMKGWPDSKSADNLLIPALACIAWPLVLVALLMIHLPIKLGQMIGGRGK